MALNLGSFCLCLLCAGVSSNCPFPNSIACLPPEGHCCAGMQGMRVTGPRSCCKAGEERKREIRKEGREAGREEGGRQAGSQQTFNWFLTGYEGPSEGHLEGRAHSLPRAPCGGLGDHIFGEETHNPCHPHIPGIHIFEDRASLSPLSWRLRPLVQEPPRATTAF